MSLEHDEQHDGDAGQTLTLYPDRYRDCEENPCPEDRIREAATQLWKSQSLIDIELQVAGGKCIGAHKLVLITESAYFRALLCGQHFSHGNTLDLLCLPPDAVRVVVEYLYTNTCTLSEGSLGEVLEAAAFLQVPALLKDLCREISDRLVPANAFSWWVHASRLELPALLVAARAAALRACTWGWDDGAGLSVETLCSLPLELICELASSGKVCATEDAMDRAVDTWLRLCGTEHKARLLSALERGAEGRARQRSMQSGRGLVLMIGGQGNAYAVLKGETARVDCYDSRSGVWSERAPLREARREAAAVTHDGDIYVLGGKIGHQTFVEDTIQILGSVELFEQYSEREEWRSVAPLLVPRAGAAAVSFHGAVYCLGGEVNLLPRPLGVSFGQCMIERLTSHVERYDPASGLWEQAPPMLHARKNFATAVLGDRLYVIGGRTIPGGVVDTAANGYPELRAIHGRRAAYYVHGVASATQSVEYFDGHDWHEAPPLTKRYPDYMGACHATAFEGKLYLMGSPQTDPGTDRDDRGSVECYDPSVGRWVEVSLKDTADIPRVAIWMDDEDDQSAPAFPTGTPAGILDGGLCILQRDRDELGQLWRFDAADSSWERLPGKKDLSGTYGRPGMCAAVLN